MPENPKLRSDLIVVPVEVSGERLLLFQDPERWCQELVFVPIELTPILQQFDGSLSVREIQENLMRQTRELVPSEVIEKIITELEERHLMDSENFHHYIAGIKTEWEKAEARPPALSGQSYPKEAEELKKMLDAFYSAQGGPGIPGENKGNSLKAVVAPHIELSGNGACYAHAYKKIIEESDAELFLILGTGHNITEDILVLSEKHYQTPLGFAQTDREFVQGVRKRLKKKSFLGDFSHRSEHSIELQVIFLQHLLQGRRDFKIVPVLVGTFQQMIELGSSPEDDLLVKDYIKAIQAQVKASGKKTLLIASADLAHLGPKYGDQETFTREREEALKADDEKMFRHLEKGDAEGFFQEVSKIKDSRKICGLAPIYFITRIAEPSRGELLKWSVWWDEQTGSAVSFCAMALY